MYSKKIAFLFLTLFITTTAYANPIANTVRDGWNSFTDSAEDTASDIEVQAEKFAQKMLLPDFTFLAEHAGKAVVNINTEKKVSRKNFFGGQGLPPEHPLNDFFNGFGGFENFRGGQAPSSPNAPKEKQRSLGSGFIISEDGLIVTNNHVIEDVDKILVRLQGDKKEYIATVVGIDPETDLALLKINARKKLPVLRFADSKNTKVGQWVLAIGNPFGLGHTVTAGIISAKGRVINAGPYDDFLQTDASINPGNSGGPLVNMNGDVVGINTAILASGQGLGFAVPASMASNIIEQLRTNKKVSRGWLGLTIQPIDETAAKALGMQKPQGVLVANVIPNEPAEIAGIQAGDIILEINNNIIESPAQLTRSVAQIAPGEKIKIALLRNGKKITLSAVLKERNIKTASKNPQENLGNPELGLGMQIQDAISSPQARQLGIKSGVIVVEVEQGSTAEQSGIERGDIVIRVNQEPVRDANAFIALLKKYQKSRGAALLQIVRGTDTFFLTVPLFAKK